LQDALKQYSDPDEQLRVAFHLESNSSDPAVFNQALSLYRLVRDQRVANVRLKIGTQYLLGVNGFPKNVAVAAKWYSFAAKAGSIEACGHLSDLYNSNLLPSGPVEAATCHNLRQK
jgi:TPR repeat protein